MRAANAPLRTVPKGVMASMERPVGPVLGPQRSLTEGQINVPCDELQAIGLLTNAPLKRLSLRLPSRSGIPPFSPATEQAHWRR